MPYVPLFCIILVAMVVAQRILHISDLIRLGHQVSVTYSHSCVSGKVKTKVYVSAEPDIVPATHRHLLLMCIQPLLEFTDKCVVVDRGHRYSDGHCVAQFWTDSPCEDPRGPPPPPPTFYLTILNDVLTYSLNFCLMT